MSQTIRLADGRAVGSVEGRVFKKRLRASRHFLRIPPAIAFDVSTLDQAEAAGATTVEVEDTDSGRTYRASIATIRERGFLVDRRFGLQVALPLERWAVHGPGVATQLSLPTQKVAGSAATEAKRSGQGDLPRIDYTPRTRP